MTTATNPHPDVALPPGARPLEAAWQDADAGDPHPHRIILAADRKITDHTLTVTASAVQWADGTIDDGLIEGPIVYVYDLDESGPLNSDQARELASALIEAAAELDRWAQR